MVLELVEMDLNELNVLANLLHNYIRLSPMPGGSNAAQRCDLIKFQEWAEVETGKAYSLEEVNQAVQVLIDFRLISAPRNWGNTA